MLCILPGHVVFPTLNLNLNVNNEIPTSKTTRYVYSNPLPSPSSKPPIAECENFNTRSSFGDSLCQMLHTKPQSSLLKSLSCTVYHNNKSIPTMILVLQIFHVGSILSVFHDGWVIYTHIPLYCTSEVSVEIFTH